MTSLSTLKIDEKWSVEYDPQNNDRPMYWLRHGERHSTFGCAKAVTAMFYALLEKQWQDVDPQHPPATHMVAIYSDGCTAETLTKFDNSDDFLMSEDAHPMTKDEVRDRFAKWLPAPEGFVPHFLEITEDDHR